jgi:membrane protein
MPEHTRLFAKVWDHFLYHKAPRMGAAVSFYALFSIGPLLIILIAVAGMFFGVDHVENAVIHYIETMVSSSSAQYIRSIVDAVQRASFGVTGAIVGGVTLVITSIGVLSELQNDLNELWMTPLEKKKLSQSPESMWGTIRSTVVEKIFIVSVLPILACVLALSTVLSRITKDLTILAEKNTSLLPSIQSLDLALSLGLGVLLFALMFRIFPKRKLPWSELFLGGLLTSTLFLVGKIGVTVYLDTIADTAIFGQAGSLVVMLIWVYYSAQVFFFGASFTFVHSLEKGVLCNDTKISSNGLS